MALSIYEQIVEYIKEAKKVVIALDKNASCDAIAAALGFSKVLKSFDKTHQITASENLETCSFLRTSIEISTGLKQARRLVITLDIREQGLEKFYYITDEEKKQLEIFIVPKNGFFNPDDVRVGQGGFEHDLIITLGAVDLGSLGVVYDDNTAFFHETPIINIDYKAANEKFGEINLIEPTKSSLSEIVFDFVDQNFKQTIDKPLATALLAGILEKTQSFKVPTLTPQTLEKASRLLSYDADRELVVRELFYNKSLPLVKLWGRSLARLKEDKQKGLYWSLLSTEDYLRSGATVALVDQVFEEIVNYLPKEGVVLLFSEYNGVVLVLGSSQNTHIDLKNIFTRFSPTPFEYGVSFKIWGKDVLDVEKEIIEMF